MNLPVIPQPGSPLATWPPQWLPLAPVLPPPPVGGGVLIPVSFGGASGAQTLTALLPGNIVRANQIAILTAFAPGTRIQLGTVLQPGLILDVLDPPVGVYSSAEFYELVSPDFLVLTVSPSNPSGAGRLLYEVQS